MHVADESLAAPCQEKHSGFASANGRGRSDVCEEILFRLACFCHRKGFFLPADARASLGSPEDYTNWRAARVKVICAAAARFNVSISGCDLLDFGCGDGSLTVRYAERGARSVAGVDINPVLLARARSVHSHDRVTYVLTCGERIPLPDLSADTVISYDVFEHVTGVGRALEELWRILRPGGKVLIGTWGWYHPFAPHLFATMPVPYAHVIFGEKTVLRVCRRIYDASWYTPTMFDLKEDGGRDPDKYLENSIPTSYVNKLLIQDFERLFRASSFTCRMYPIPFSNTASRWFTAMFLRIPGVREFLTGYLWVVLTKETKHPYSWKQD